MTVFDTMASGNVECPCCHGKKYLLVHDPDYIAPPTKENCCHCGNAGVIPPDMRSTNTHE